MRVLAALLAVTLPVVAPVVEEPLSPERIEVDTQTRRMKVLRAGRVVSEYEIGLGMQPGCKEKRGDLRTPCGVYRVLEKHRGRGLPEIFGGFWIRLDYPGLHDAARGLRDGLIDRAEHDGIVAATRRGARPPQGTALGGGIGIHTFPFEWDGKEGGRISWGCIVMHPADAARLYKEVNSGTIVVLKG